MSDITNAVKSDRFLKLHKKMTDTFTKHNDLSYSIFRIVSKFSELLPDSLNNLVRLSDMVTDALVVSGRSSLSRSLFNTKIISNSLNINTESNSLTLNYKTARNYAINVKKSYIQTNNSYSIYNEDKTSLSSLEALIKGTPIRLETEEQYFKYTFALALEAKGSISCVDIALSLNTSSYPLVSEIYYINDNNKKVYCTILNSSENQYSLDTDRQKNNVYTILLPNIKTNRLFITLEDKDKTDLVVKSIGVRKLEYEAEGEITLGPIVSSFPILKASVEALGDVNNANFYISPDNSSWYELATPNELSFTESLNKIIAFNTVSADSLKAEEDFKELYLKVRLKRSVATEEDSFYRVSRQDLASNTTSIADNPEEITVYESKETLHYGESTYKDYVVGSDIYVDTFSFVESKGEYFVKGFVETPYSIIPTSEKRTVDVTTKALKIGADDIDATKFEPISSNVYGFSVTTSTGRVNTKIDEDLVLILNKDYPKDIYSIIQNDKEIKLDLSLGFILTGLEAIVFVVPDLPVTLLDSTSRLIKTLTIKEYNGSSYINLLEEGVFDIPTSSYKLNTLYPLRLNASDEYGLKDGKIVTKDHIVDFKDIARVAYELIDFEIKLSKENGNSIVLLDKVLKEKYTEYSEEVIPAYNGTTVVKLRNKHIKKGSLTLSIKND